MARSRRLATFTLLVAALAVVGLVASCARQPGQPRPVGSTPASSATTNGPEPSATAQSVHDLDLCELLTPEDFPFEPSSQFPPRQELKSTGCHWTTKKGGPTNSFITRVGVLAIPFDQYQPPGSSPNVRMTEIAGRPAWVGTPLPSEVGAVCGAVFGAADGLISMVLLDETDGRPDPCRTIVELAEVVASRTPPPNE